MPRQSKNRVRESNLKRWKTFSEKEVLDCYFILDPNWSRKTIDYLKSIVKLSESQIYKWGYEKKKKLRSQQERKSQKNFVLNNGTENFELSNNQDFNIIVNELFPIGQNESEELSDDERIVYDRVRDEIRSKDAEIQKMSELDKLLLERINLDDVVYGVQNTANGTSLSKRISPLSIDTSFNTPKKIRCNSFDEIQSSSTMTPSKSAKESKIESKLFEEVPDFEEFYSDDKYGFNVINSNICEIEDEQVTHNQIEYCADDMFEVNEPISFFNEDTIQ